MRPAKISTSTAALFPLAPTTRSGGGAAFQGKGDDFRFFDLSLVGVFRDRLRPNLQFLEVPFLGSAVTRLGHQKPARRPEPADLPLIPPLLIRTTVTGYVPHSISALPGKSRAGL